MSSKFYPATHPFVFIKGLAILLFCLVLGSCSSSGPQSSEIFSQVKASKDTQFKVDLVDLDENSLPALLSYQPENFQQKFGSKNWRPTSTVGVGDVISVVIWEPSDQGLFSSTASGNRAELGPFQVQQDGKISVPYIGYITVKGRTIPQIRWAIQSQLAGKAIDPQVNVMIKENASNLVAVNGDVKQAGRYELSLRGDRILDIVAKAGGASKPMTETQISIIRKGALSSQLLSDVVDNPQENIFVRPGDQVNLKHDPFTFTAFGAVKKVGQYPIEASDLTLIETLGRLGGLDDNRANASGVFVFRYENAELLKNMGLLSAEYSLVKAPVIYRIDMKQAKSYFFAQSFTVRDKDIVYVANSFGGQLQKFVKILAGVTGLGVVVASAT